MRLSGILHSLKNTEGYARIKAALLENEAISAHLLTAARSPFMAALSLDIEQPILIVTASPEEARKRVEQLRAWCPEERPVLPFPELDGLPFERIVQDPSTIHDRLKVLFTLSNPDNKKDGMKNKGTIVVASSSALASITPVFENFTKALYYLHVGMKVSPMAVLDKFRLLGYILEDTETPGTMSHRGGIIDIFPPHLENPVRIDFFGNVIESLRFFHPITKRSIKEIEVVWVSPARERAPLETGISLENLLESLDITLCSEEARNQLVEELSLIVEGAYRPDLEFYSPIFNRGNILDYLPKGSLLVLEEPQIILQEAEKLELDSLNLKEVRVKQGELPLNFPSIYLALEELKGKIKKYRPALSLLAFPDAGALSLPFAPAPSLAASFASGFGSRGKSPAPISGEEIKPDKAKAIVIVSSQSSRIAEMLEERGILAIPQGEMMEPARPGNLYLIQGFLEEGWALKMEGSEGSLLLLTDREILGIVKQRRTLKRHVAGTRLLLPILQPGDYVVHIDHGLARFRGIVRKVIEDVEREYLELEYASQDKLYVPVNQIDRLSRYVGTSGEAPTVTRLGTGHWQRTKGRARKAVREVAAELLEIYARRQLIEGFAFSPDNLWQCELEDSFIYEETPDQSQACLEVKQDMEKPRPMDRLICGDVGFGKTEVAIRASFKAVMDGKQVAVLVPTTVLAQQHYYIFQERLKAFPVRVEALSRFKTPKEQQKIIQGLKDGAVDICIGTHRLLQKDVSFKDLGLVIIDEEQRFGVMHKEKLKALRKEVDVITMSATPIPRTLHLALTGLRDTSIMETPPEERLPIKTFIAEHNERLIKEAIIREMERGGQIFFVHNRVQAIPRMASKLQSLVPQARLSVAHGQMPEEELEEVMLKFTWGEIDVLLCSTIIESGLDIPRANTILVNDADRLGLTQLYHLRGRIGRGNIQAYAYFFYQPLKILSRNARKRLQTIYEATELGSGFRIAMMDLEMRGAGNILGKEQSGHIDAVGFELYTQLLSEAVEELKTSSKELTALESETALRIPRPSKVTLDLPLSFYIPKDYIAEEKSRLEVYMRLSRIKNMEALKDIEEEMKDRFGSLPGPVINLIQGIRLKLLAEKAGVSSLCLENDTLVLRAEKDLKYTYNLDGLYMKYGKLLNIGIHQLRLNISPLGDGWLKALEEILTSMRMSS